MRKIILWILFLSYVGVLFGFYVSDRRICHSHGYTGAAISTELDGFCYIDRDEKRYYDPIDQVILQNLSGQNEKR